MQAHSQNVFAHLTFGVIQAIAPQPDGRSTLYCVWLQASLHSPGHRSPRFNRKLKSAAQTVRIDFEVQSLRFGPEKRGQH